MNGILLCTKGTNSKLGPASVKVQLREVRMTAESPGMVGTTTPV